MLNNSKMKIQSQNSDENLNTLREDADADVAIEQANQQLNNQMTPSMSQSGLMTGKMTSAFQQLDSGYSKQEDLHVFMKMIRSVNFNQNSSFHTELQQLFDDASLCNSDCFVIYMLILIYKLVRNEAQEKDKKDKQLFATDKQIMNENNFFDQDNNFQSNKQQTMMFVVYLQKYHSDVYNQIFQHSQNFDFSQFINIKFIKKKIAVMIKYFIKNDFKELSKQFFKLIPLTDLIEYTLKDPTVNQFIYSFYINVVYKLAYKIYYNFDDLSILQALYKSYKAHTLILQLKSHSSSGNNSKFIQTLVTNNYQYILLRFLYKISKRIHIDSFQFMNIIDKKMYLFIEEFSKTQQFEPLIKNHLIFEKLLIESSNVDLIIYQIPIFKLISSKFQLQLSNQQYNMILEKYQNLLQDESKLKSLYFNQLYTLCAISHMLIEFVDRWHNKYHQFKHMSQLYMEIAEDTIFKMKKNQTLYLVLFQKHYIQEDKLINILFKNIDHFQSILNKPLVYKVLRRLWMGNRQYSNNIMNESFLYMSLQKGYNIMQYNQNITKVSSKQPQLSQTVSRIMENQQYLNINKPDKYYDIHDIESEELLMNNQQQQKKQHSKKFNLDSVKTDQDIPINNQDFIKKYQNEPVKQRQSINFDCLNIIDLPKTDANIFKSLITDTNNPQLGRNYMYQYQIYLYNLNFKKVYDIAILCISFYIFLSMVLLYFDRLSPAIEHWDHNYAQLLQWKVPKEIESIVKVNQTRKQAYVDESYKLTKTQLINIAMNGQQGIYCDKRQLTFDWSKSSTKHQEDNLIFCKRVMKYEPVVRLGYLDRFNYICMLNIIIGLKSLLNIILMYLNHKKLVINSQSIYDFIIIIAQQQTIVTNNQLKTKLLFDAWLLTYFRYIQFSSVIVIFFLFQKLQGTMMVFKSIGIYLIILEKIIKQILYFLLYFFVLMVIIGICSYLLFKMNDDASSTTSLSIFTTLQYSLGSVKLHGKTDFLAVDPNNKNIMRLIQNFFKVIVAFLLLVIMLNMLIALLSNMYQEVVDSTEREFSKLIYVDYNENCPNEYYSSMDHNPSFLSIFMIAMCPILIYYKSKRLNTTLNVGIFIIKFFIPFIIIYYAINILLLPFVYLKILFCIVTGRYTEQHYRTIWKTKMQRFYHFIQFAFLGIFYLLFKILVIDLMYLINKASKKIPEDLDLVFNGMLYRVFKKTLQYYKYILKQVNVPINEFNEKLVHFQKSDDSKDKLQDKYSEKIYQLQQKLQVYTYASNKQIDVEYFIRMISLMKNKRQNPLIDKKQIMFEKFKQLEIILDQYEGANKY